MASNDHRRCSACGELSSNRMQRFIGGWFFIRCPNCRSLLRIDPQQGHRWTLLTAFGLIVNGAIAAVTTPVATFAVAFAMTRVFAALPE